MNAANCRTVALACLVLFTTTAYAQGQPLRPGRIVPDELVWTTSPRGFQTAKIVGDSKKAGTYVVRVLFPAGLHTQPHFHPDDRVVTVLSGTMYFGYGDQFDETKMKALPAGSVWTEPANQPHFSWAKDGEAVIETIGTGPSGTTNIQSKH